MKNREIRTIIGKVESRAEEDGKITLVGQPIVFNQRTNIGGYFEEEIAPEAVEESVLRDVCFLVNHDSTGTKPQQQCKFKSSFHEVKFCS